MTSLHSNRPVNTYAPGALTCWGRLQRLATLEELVLPTEQRRGAADDGNAWIEVKPVVHSAGNSAKMGIFTKRRIRAHALCAHIRGYFMLRSTMVRAARRSVLYNHTTFLPFDRMTGLACSATTTHHCHLEQVSPLPCPTFPYKC